MSNFSSIGDVLDKIKKQNTQDNKAKKPIQEWQGLALKIIEELNIPPFKKSSVFKICKTFPPNIVNAALNDTKELCTKGEQWKYFFKVASELKKPKPTTKEEIEAERQKKIANQEKFIKRKQKSLFG